MFILNWSNPTIPSKTAINVPVGSVVSDQASVRFTGKGAAGYGAVQQESLMHLLENFASDVAPVFPTIGQEWYDTQNSILKVCTSVLPTVAWKAMAGIQVVAAGEPAPASAAVGDVWFERTGASSGVLYVYTGIGRYPTTGSTVGGWNQVWPTIEITAGREEYDACLALLNQLAGDPALHGGSGALGKLLSINDLTPLDASLAAALAARSPVDANVLVPVGEATSELAVDPTSNDWDLLLAAARSSLARLDLPSALVAGISPVPFVTDGRQAPSTLTSLSTTDVRYPSLERRSGRRFGLVTLIRLFQETTNALSTAVANRYSLKGISGANGTNPTFASAVTVTTLASTSGSPAGASSGTATLSFLFPSAAALQSFCTSGAAFQLRASLTAGSTTGDVNLKTLFDGLGVLRISTDKIRVFANVLPYALALAPINVDAFGGAGSAPTLMTALSTQTLGGAAYTVSTQVSGTQTLLLKFDFISTGALQGTITLACDVIRDTSTYGSSVPLYGAPSSGSFTSRSAYLV